MFKAIAHRCCVLPTLIVALSPLWLACGDAVSNADDAVESIGEGAESEVSAQAEPGNEGAENEVEIRIRYFVLVQS